MKNSKGEKAEAGQLVEDKFEALWKKRDVDPARVAVGVSEGMDYGALKVSVTVSVACDQNESTINKAGELAFYKALELMRDGWGELSK
jgi:hypothetical protein